MDTEGYKILVADDSKTVRNFIIDIVKTYDKKPIEIVEAEDGEQALKALKDDDLDIAFIDVHMPGATGVEVVAMMQELKLDIFAVSISGDADEETVESLQRFGAYNFLEKPVTPEQILNALNNYATIKTKQKVLIVDDSATVRHVVARVLYGSIFAMELVHANSGQEAINIVAKKKFNLVITDLNMPEINGLELVTRLAKTNADLDIIMMSTDLTEELEREAQQLGVRAYLKKPFYPVDMDSILHEIHGLHHPSFSKNVKMFQFT